MKPLNRFPVRMALAVMISTLFVSTAVAEEGWLVDFEKAKAQAAKEGKPILMEFTGSDWCPPCKALHKNVLVKDPGPYLLIFHSFDNIMLILASLVISFY